MLTAPDQPAARCRPATLADVAREAGVTRWIAGAILNGGDNNSRCAPETAERIRAAAARLGYRPNPAARVLSGKRSHTFGLLVASAGDPLVSFLVQHLHVEALRHGCSVLIGNTVDGTGVEARNFGACIDEFARRGVDGVFCAVHPWWPGDRGALLDRFPTTVFYGDPGIDDARFIAPDRRLAGRLPVEHLVEKGRRRIGLALMTLLRPTHRQRMAGHVEALVAAGLAADAPTVFDASIHGMAFPTYDHLTKQWGYPEHVIDTCIDELVGKGKADAIVAHDDFFAAVLLRRLRHRGMRVPDDVAVVGSLNHYLADWTDPPLTSLDPGHAEAARGMVDAAERLVAGKTVEPGTLARIAPRLVARAST